MRADFYRHHRVFIRSFQVRITDLERSVCDAVKRRNKVGIAYNPYLQLFTDDFCTNEACLKRWEMFLKMIQRKESIPFADVMAMITGRLKGLFDRYWEEK